MTTHEDISKRAREIWEREGRPEGRDKEHWLQAETELREETLKTQNGSNHISSDENGMLKVPAGVGKENLREDASRKRSGRRPK